MFTRPAFFLPLLALSLSAQVPGQLTDLTPQQRVDITRNAGLQPDGAGGLLGGGQFYQANFSPTGMRLVPALGPDCAELQHLRLRPLAVQRGTTHVVQGELGAPPVQDGTTVRYAHAAGVEERYEVGVDGVEVSWWFAQRPAGSGDLVVRYAVDTTLPAPQAGPDGGLEFVLPEIGGVAVGTVTGIDANGATIAGRLRHVAGAIEMSLPAQFVDHAAYPLVLDPLVGPKINVDTSGWDDAEPDVAYDSSTQYYLVTFMRTFSGGVVWPRAQRVSSAGGLIAGTIFFAASGTCERARVANLPSRNRFGVVFEETDGIFNGIQFRTVDAASGLITHQAVLASSTGVNLYSDPDIGGDAYTPAIANRGFVVIFEDNIFNAIRARKVYFDGADQLVSPSAVNILVNGGTTISTSYTQPAISRAAAGDARLLVAARRFSGLGPFVSINVAVVNTETLNVLDSTSLGGSQTASITNPDVDGFNGQWVVAWQQGTPSPGVARRTIGYDASGFTLGATETLGGSILSQVSYPTVGYTPGRTWLGYRSFSGLVGTGPSLRAAAIDSASAAWCSDVFSEALASGAPETRIVVGTMTSGGLTAGEGALAVFGENDNIYAQRLINYGSSGSYTNLGGGCGSGGSQIFSHSPGIGSSGLICTVQGLPPTALATIFNFSEAAGTLPCGACVWNPFQATQSPGIYGPGLSTVEFPIPCLPSLVGGQFETQWTTVDFTQAPCPLFPGLALSDRVRMTIGN